MASHDDIQAAQAALLKAITEHAGQTAYARNVKDWAEAYAWITSPAQSHGGSTTVKS